MLAANTAAASQIRYLNHILMQQLRSHPAFAGLTRIQVRLQAVRPRHGERPPKQPARAAPHPLSARTVEHLESLAKFHDGSELSEVLYRLASRGRRKEEPT